MILGTVRSSTTGTDAACLRYGAAAEKRGAEGHNVRQAAGSHGEDGVIYLRRSWFVCFGHEHEQSDLRAPFLQLSIEHFFVRFCFFLHTNLLMNRTVPIRLSVWFPVCIIY